MVIARVRGVQAAQRFQDEPGGHRWQRKPPIEKRGRTHTRTVTVAVLPEPTEVELRLDSKEIEWTATRGSGAGGQHRNVTASAVQVRHRLSGLMVRVESEHSQHMNRQAALQLLRARLWEQARQAAGKARAADRSRLGSHRASIPGTD
jgi:peptide chain release factor 1